MYEFLEKIDKYLLANNIQVYRYHVKAEAIDEFFRIAVTNMIRRMALKDGDDTTYFDDAEYYLRRDVNGRLCLIAETKKNKKGKNGKNGKNGYYRVVVCSGSTDDVKFNDEGEYQVYSQRYIMRIAALYKLKTNERNDIRDSIDSNPEFNNKTPLDKKAEEIRQMDSVVRKAFRECVKPGARLMNPTYTKSNYETDNNGTINNIIDGFNECYFKSPIFYEEPIVLPIENENSTETDKHFCIGRVHPEISLDDRAILLDSYGPIYRGLCCTCGSNTNEFNYLFFLYHLGNGKFLFVFEPRICNTYTKAFIYDSGNETMNMERIRNMASDYLHRSYATNLGDKYSFRSSHSTLDNLKGFMNCFFDVSADLGKINGGLKVHRHERRELYML